MKDLNFLPTSTKWSVYIVECSDGSFYTGATNNIEKRIKNHNSGVGAKYTRSRLPVILIHEELIGTRSEAQKREHAIKKLSRSEKKILIKGNL